MIPKKQSGLFVAILLLCGAAAFVIAQEKSEGSSSPMLTLDNTPISDGKAPMVQSYASVIEPVQKAVVSVYSSRVVRDRVPEQFNNPLFRQFFGEPQAREHKEEGLGSGVIVTADGYILTNNHVVAGADELKVLLPDEREFTARVIGTDPKTDVAVIKIDAGNLPTVSLANSDLLRVGDVVFAVGNPLGIGQTVTMGIVSATGRKHLGLLEGGYENFIQTDAAINQGNSGGALVDAKGRLVGINTAIISTTRGNIGIGFAIPSSLAANIMHSLVETGTVQRGFLGVSMGEPLTPELAEAFGLEKDQRGVPITQVTPDSPAAEAGLERNDVIAAVDGKPVTTREDLRLIIAQKLPGTSVELKVWRKGKPVNIGVKLGNLPDDVASAQVLNGVTVASLTDEQREQLGLEAGTPGVVITEVDRSSPFADRLLPNMVILEINREPVSSAGEARSALKNGRNLVLVFYRGVYRYLTVTVR